MATFKRIFLFLAVNILVMVTITFVLSMLGVRPYLNAYGMDYEQLAIFCLVWGMAGSFISLALSRVMAKMMMGVKLVDPSTSDPLLQEYVQAVRESAKAAGLSTLPEIGIYDSPELNAFATGPTKKRALVAVSTGLLRRMSRSEMQGVIGHEVAHIANGDMVTMTLVQGIVNAFAMFLARILAFALANAMRGNRDSDSAGASYGLQMVFTIVFEIVFMILGTMVVAAFSRYREFRADAGGARLMGRDSMIAALEALRRNQQIRDPEHASPAIQALQISTKRSWLALFSTHPPLEDRIARLEMMRG